MSGIVKCGKCGELTQQETVAGKLTKKCKKCRTKHTNNNKQEPKLKTETQPTNGFYKAEVFNMCENEDTQEDVTTQEEQQEPQEEGNKTIKQLITEINNNIKCFIDIQSLNHTETIDIFNMLNNKMDNIQNNINNTATNILNKSNDDFIKEQQTQNQIITNKLDNLIKAIT